MILSLIKEYFGNGETFSPFEFHVKTGIDIKVCHMTLKKLYNNGKIGGFVKNTYNYYFLKNELSSKLQ